MIIALVIVVAATPIQKIRNDIQCLSNQLAESEETISTLIEYRQLSQ